MGTTLRRPQRLGAMRNMTAPVILEQQQPPYTMEEIHAMIAQSERDIAEGRCRDIEELFREWDEENSATFAAEPEIEYNSNTA